MNNLPAIVTKMDLAHTRAMNHRIKDALDSILKKDEYRTPKRTNRMSSMGAACTRFLALEWEEWGSMTPFSAETLKNMAKGRVAEDYFVGLLRRAYPGKVLELQTALEAEEKISGHIDFAILESAFADDPTPFDTGLQKDRLIIMDVKATNLYGSMNSLEDLLKNRWTRSWPIQLNGYIHAGIEKWGACPVGYFFLVDPSSYDHKLIEIPYIPELWEWTVARAKQINESLLTRKFPDQINDPETCKDCRLLSVCCPDLMFDKVLQFYTDAGLERDLGIENEWGGLHSAYGKIYTRNRDRLKALHDRDLKQDSFFVGETMVRVSIARDGKRTFKF